MMSDNLSVAGAAVEFRNNVLALAATAKLYGMPTILTTSLDQGPNGPLLPEIRNMFPDAPLIKRPGEINAWDNGDFVKAVKVSSHCGEQNHHHAHMLTQHE